MTFRSTPATGILTPDEPVIGDFDASVPSFQDEMNPPLSIVKKVNAWRAGDPSYTGVSMPDGDYDRSIAFLDL